MPYYAQEAYRAVKPNVPFGCINGGGLYDGRMMEYVWTCGMPDGVLELVQCIDEQLPEVGIQVCCFDKTYFAKENNVMADFRRATGIPNLVCHYRGVKTLPRQNLLPLPREIWWMWPLYPRSTNTVASVRCR